MIDKNKEFIRYLRGCPEIDKIYISFADAKSETRSFVPLTNSRHVKTYIDGGKLMYFDFVIVDYSQSNINPVPMDDNKVNKNILDLAELQKIIDWVNTQKEERNFPAFGEDCEPEELYSLTANPGIAGVDQNGLAKYTIQIRYEYVERMKK